MTHASTSLWVVSALASVLSGCFDTGGLPDPFYESATDATVEENSEAVFYVAEARDPDGDPLRFGLVGADAGEFVIDASSGELRFAAAPDFERPTSASGTNVYTIEIRAEDENGEGVTSPLTVTVTNVLGDDCTDLDEDGLGRIVGPDDSTDCPNEVADTDDDNPRTCSDVDNDGCDDCAITSFNPGNDGEDNDGDGICIELDCNDRESGCATSSTCGEDACAPLELLLTLVGTSPVAGCTDETAPTLELSLDAAGASDAAEFLRCQGEQYDVFPAFEFETDLDSWITSGEPGRAAQRELWGDGFGPSCPQADDSENLGFVRFDPEGSAERILDLGPEIDTRGLSDVRLEATLASRDGSSTLRISACCADTNRCFDDGFEELAIVDVTSDDCATVETSLELPTNCVDTRLRLAKDRSDTSFLALDDVRIVGRPTLSAPIRDEPSGIGFYSTVFSSCAAGDYEVFCTFDNRSLAAIMSNAVTITVQ
ncbi:MAG: cadherin repeat domain-containing protein [Myxococcota bacterium]